MSDDVAWLVPLLAFLAGLLLGRWSARQAQAPETPRAEERDRTRVSYLGARVRMAALLGEGHKTAATRTCRADTDQSLSQASALVDLLASRRAR